MGRKQPAKTVQLTIRGVPVQVKRLFHQRAQTERKSLNAVLVEVLSSSAGFSSGELGYGDLDDLVGLWQEDPEFDRALSAQDEIDESLWR